jgi:hypothetical protein
VNEVNKIRYGGLQNRAFRKKVGTLFSISDFPTFYVNFSTSNAMISRFIPTDPADLTAILERAFAHISNPLAAGQGAWSVLERALAEAYQLGAATGTTFADPQLTESVFKAA